jgi:ubiquinone/menaquinone biosynthesis C-methylase UbiE
MHPKLHWEQIFTEKTPDSVSWYQPHLGLSLLMIDHVGVTKTDAIIDVGGGASTLVDDLLAAGFDKVSVLDVSAKALQTAKSRLGKRADDVTWIEADIADVHLPEHQYALWHDRAMFHFLTDDRQRREYVQLAMRSTSADGSLIIATFASDGPQQCSGLNTFRYGADELSNLFADGFDLVETISENHVTPWQSEQKFIYCRFKRRQHQAV